MTVPVGHVGSLALPMPIYEYRCPNGHTFERFQSMTAPAPEKCDVCGASPIEIVLFPVAVHYKGSGFYSTDYGKKGKAAASKDGGGAGDLRARSSRRLRIVVRRFVVHEDRRAVEDRLVVLVFDEDREEEDERLAVLPTEVVNAADRW